MVIEDLGTLYTYLSIDIDDYTRCLPSLHRLVATEEQDKSHIKTESFLLKTSRDELTPGWV